MMESQIYALVIPNFGNFIVCFFVILFAFFTLNFCFACLALLSKKSKQAIPSITDGVHRTENFVDIIPVFSTFSNFFTKKEKKNIKAILCNFSMQLLKYF